MGLSDEERFQGIVWSIYRFDDILGALKRQEYLGEYDRRLVELIEELWPAFLSKKGNSLYWIMGTDQLSVEVTPAKLLGVALLSAKDRVEPDDWEAHRRAKREKGERTTLDYLFVHKPEIIKILGSSSITTALKAFFEVERAFYYLNRYDDKFRAGYEELAKVLSKIWGITFRLIEGSVDLLSAYCIHNLLEIILPYKDDLVSQWWQKHNLHHSTRIGVIEPAEVLELWKGYQKGRLKQYSEEERILLTLKIIGRRYHYAHEHDDLLRMIKEANKGRKKSKKIVLKHIKAVLEKCAEDHKKEEKKRKHTFYRFCWLTDNRWDE